jgi:FkbM family methyltransferase
MHIGGHRGQDGHSYQVIMKDESRIIWAEPDIANAQVIQGKYPSQKVLTDVFWSEKNAEINFYKTKDSEKSSAKKPIEKLTETVVEELKLLTTTIDNEMPKDAKKCLLVLDVQGGEIEVLRGGSETFNQVKWIVLEVTANGAEYENVPTEMQLD